MDPMSAVLICGPSTYNDQTKDSFGVTKEQRGCPAGYGSQAVKPIMNSSAKDDYCLTNADCNVGTDAGDCSADPLDRKQDGGFRLSCRCNNPGQISNCPNKPDAGVITVCRYGPQIPNICVKSVVCHPSFNIFQDAGFPSYGCGL